MRLSCCRFALGLANHAFSFQKPFQNTGIAVSNSEFTFRCLVQNSGFAVSNSGIFPNTAARKTTGLAVTRLLPRHLQYTFALLVMVGYWSNARILNYTITAGRKHTFSLFSLKTPNALFQTALSVFPNTVCRYNLLVFTEPN